MNATMLRRYGAEVVGTFAYVFFGCGAKIVQGNDQGGMSRLLIYLTFGLSLFAMTYALSHISAAPFNPAITLGLAVTRRFPWRYVVPYWLSQVCGALLASAAHWFLLPRLASQNNYGATIPTIGTWQALGIEAIITFFLMLVAMSTATERRVNRAVVGLATGLTVAIAGFFAGPLTGGSMNPARSLAPALFAGGLALQDVWIYWVGPLSGAVAGALLYEVLRGDESYAVEAPEHIFEHLTHRKKPLAKEEKR
jgi:MIP family channel proteins